MIEPQVKNQECSSSTAIVVICAEIYALANRTEFWNQRIGERVSVSEFTLGRR